MRKHSKFFLFSISAIVLIFCLIVFFVLYYILRVRSTADCAWVSEARTWIDSNGDGILNNNERPLSDVNIHVDDPENNLIDVSNPAKTDGTGSANLVVWLPGCPNVSFEVYADVPSGYKITTPQRIKVNKDFWGDVETNTIYYFGFSPE